MEAWRKELYLVHHGIKGQKWGVRNGPPYPLGASDHSASEKKAGWRKSLNGGTGQETQRKKKLTKEGSSGKIKKAVDNFKSDYREGLKAEYLEKHNKRTPFHKSEGKTEADAEKFADGRMKAMKALAIVGGVAVTAMAAKYAYDHVIPQYVDRTLKEGTKFKRVAGSADSDLNRAFYMARSKRDARRYVGVYGDQVRKRGNDPHQLTGALQKAVKVASNKNAADTFKDLYESDSEFKRMVNERIQESLEGFGIMGAFAPAAKVQAKTLERIKSGKVKSPSDFKNLYEAFNISFADHGNESDAAVDKFYEALKKKGYGAINDINDQWYSGYNTNTANIVFDTDSVIKESVRKLADEEVDKINASENIKMLVEATLPYIGGTAAAMVAAKAFDTAEKGREINEKKRQKQSGKKKEDDS